MPVIALGLGAFLLLNKKKKVTGIGDDIIPLALIGYAGWYFFIKNKKPAGSLTVDQMRQALTALALSDKSWVSAITSMTDQEITDSYIWVFQYVHPGIKDQAPADLKTRIQAISDKYKIFT